VRLLSDVPRTERARSPLGELRNELGKLAEQTPKELPARFEHYLETAALHCGYRLEPVRVHLEVGLERIFDGLLPGGAIERKNLADLRKSLDRAASEARTVSELFAAYRRAISDISDAVLHPVAAHRDRNLRRAVAYLHEHYSEALTLADVARVGGFAPNYLSALFKKRERMTFASYLRRLRIERARQLLATTDLALQRVAQLSGFGTAGYMARVFRTTVGQAPRVVRKQLR
jgi:YesN/AraC family two-component response regulator